MGNRVQYSTLTRLLTLNTETHDLKQQLSRVGLKAVMVDGEARLEPVVLGQVASLQEKVDRDLRATLMTCWLEDKD